MELFFFWLVLSIVAGIIAASKGRTGFGYFFLSLVLSPLVGLILVIALPKHNPTIKYPGQGTDLSQFRVPCSECGEQIIASAKVCRFCGHKREAAGTTSAAHDST